MDNLNSDRDVPTSDYELRHALQEYEGIDDKIMHVDELIAGGVLEDFVIVFLPPPSDGGVGGIGHWCLLHWLDDEENVVEWFDPLAKPMPEALENWLELKGYDWVINPVQLQDYDTNSCGKFVVSRLMSLPSCLCDYIKVLTGNKLKTPNEIVEILVKLKRFTYGR